MSPGSSESDYGNPTINSPIVCVFLTLVQNIFVLHFQVYWYVPKTKIENRGFFRKLQRKPSRMSRGSSESDYGNRTINSKWIWVSKSTRLSWTGTTCLSSIGIDSLHWCFFMGSWVPNSKEQRSKSRRRRYSQRNKLENTAKGANGTHVLKNIDKKHQWLALQWC